MRSSILEVGSFWYSAWIDAGQLELKNFKKPGRLTQEEKQQIKDEAIQFNKGKISIREED